MLPKGKDEWTFKKPLGAFIFRQLHTLAEFKAGRPSDFGICSPNEDLPLMMAFVLRRNQMAEVEANEQRKRSENAQVRQGFLSRFRKKK